MAIFHLHNDTISRGKGQSVVAAAAYRARERLLDETTGQTKDYTKKTEQPVLFSGIYMPKNAPQWTREQLWNAAERAEDEHNRKSWRVAIMAQDMDMALMDELTPEQNRRLLQDYIREQFTRYGYAVDANIHGPHKDGDQRNIHAHLLITMRTLDAKGFSAVKRQMDRKEFSQWVDHWREAWAKTAARHLERAGHHQAAERMAYGHLTLEQQRKIALEKGDHEHAADLAREASQHAGPKATQMERDGKASERGNENRATATRNRAHRERLGELHRELSQVNSEIATAPEPTPQHKPAPAPTPGPAATWWKAASQRAALNRPAPRPTGPRAERRDQWEQAAAKRLQGLRNWQALEREQQQRRFTEAAKLERGDAVKAFNTQQRHDLTHLLYKDQAEALAGELQRQQERRERWDKPTQRREPRPRTHPPQGFKAWLAGLFTAKAATPAPTTAPARPLADAEPQKAPEESLRERLEEQEEEKQEENRQQKGRARPPEPHHERAEKSRVELRKEQLHQHRGQRRTPPRR
jgi:hypothetical protein